MTLKEYLKYIYDVDLRIELELDIEEDDDYSYTSFWLNDFRLGTSHCLKYSDWTIERFSIEPVMYDNAKLSIQIKP